MKLMIPPKSLFATLLIAAGLVVTNAAAETPESGKPPRPPKDPGARVDKMKQELGLTEDQAKSIRSIMDDTHASMEKLRGDSSLSEDQKREQAKAARDQSREKIGEVLTAEQKAKWESMRPEKKEQGGKPNKDRPKPAQPNPDKTQD